MYYTLIVLIATGIVPETVVKTNLINAYGRYLRTKGGKLGFYANGERLVDWIDTGNEAVVMDTINNRLRIVGSSGSCVNWNLSNISTSYTDVYIVTDQNPCKKSERIKGQGNKVVAIGMGGSVQSRFLERACGPCSYVLGCIQGWDWFILP